MDSPEEKFLRCVDTINDNNYNYGNEVLYKNCGFACLEDAGKLSSAIWLIGKSYSADPTRSAPKDTFKNKGLGSSFERIAEELVSSNEYNSFCISLKELRKKEYNYTDSELFVLESTVDHVSTFNTMIKNAMSTVARDKHLEKVDSDNVVSFCSKFLHFMCPHLFFIIDSYSRKGGFALYRGTAKRTLYISEDTNQNLDIDQTVKALFRGDYSFRRSVEYKEPAIQDYYEHCLRAYGLARFLREKGKACARQITGEPNSCYMPRLVDSVLMRITD